MPNFRAATNADRKPPRCAVLSPLAFSSRWKERPDADVAVGLLFISGTDLDMAHNHALERAEEWSKNEGRRDEPHFNKVYNEQFIYYVVAHATCDPNDRDEPYFRMPVEDTIRDALTFDGARRLWDELQLLHAGSGVSMPVAGDDDVRKLAVLLARGTALSKANPAQQIEARKLVSYLIEQIGPFDPSANPKDADDLLDDDDTVTDDGEGYVVVAPE